ncbi:MAG: transcription factor FapR [Synergistales bacterium]|nr:transcription factor FapR [Synergistales bacterium]
MEGSSLVRSRPRRERHQRLQNLLENNPLYTDDELAAVLGVSVSTIRLDRTLLGLPELRERMRRMAQTATSRLTSMRHEDVVGELLELEPDSWALSVIQASRDMAFRDTDIIWDHHIYSQASSLAMAVIEARLVVTGAARVNYRKPALVGDRLIAKAKVGSRKGNKTVVSVRTRVEGKEIFVGRFVVVTMDERSGLSLDADTV